MLAIGMRFLVLSFLIYVMENHLGIRRHYISTIVIVLLVYCMTAGNYQNVDISNYESTYNTNTMQWSFKLFAQWAYFLTINACNILHLSFMQYRFVVYGLGFLVLIIAICRTEMDPYPVFLLYCFFPMIIDATQMKSFVAMCFITLAITFLIKGTKKDKFWFIVFIIIGSGFHVTALVFVPLVILCDNNYNIRVKTFSVFPIVMFAALFSNRRMSSILSGVLLKALSDSSFDRAEMYLTSRVNYGFIIYFVATFLLLFIVMKVRYMIISNEYSFESEKNYSNIVFYCAIFSLAFLPLYFIKLDFARLLRMFIPTYHILLVMTFGVSNRQYSNSRTGAASMLTSTMAIVIFVYLLSLSFMFYWEIYNFKDSVMMPFFTYNIFMG